jgi:hypothetical protein
MDQKSCAVLAWPECPRKIDLVDEVREAADASWNGNFEGSWTIAKWHDVKVENMLQREKGLSPQNRSRDDPHVQQNTLQEPGHLEGADEAAREASQACAAACQPRTKHGTEGVDGAREAATANEGHLWSDHVSMDAQEGGGGVWRLVGLGKGAAESQTHLLENCRSNIQPLPPGEFPGLGGSICSWSNVKSDCMPNLVSLAARSFGGGAGSMVHLLCTTPQIEVPLHSHEAG